VREAAEARLSAGIEGSLADFHPSPDGGFVPSWYRRLDRAQLRRVAEQHNLSFGRPSSTHANPSKGRMPMTYDVALDRTIFDLAPPTEEQLRELAAGLDDQERRVLLEHGTEAPVCGIFLDEKREAVFTCRLCGLPLFSGGTKFESGTGWPSFTSPFAEGHLSYIRVPATA
jgi:hypothetical protein